MLSGVVWSMQEVFEFGENDYHPPLPNRHRLLLHDIRRAAVRASVSMREEGDMVKLKKNTKNGYSNMENLVWFGGSFAVNKTVKYCGCCHFLGGTGAIGISSEVISRLIATHTEDVRAIA
ncbi:hypothetical protein C5167_028315 [Papaver somniferum]|nr:hypothetical protein C5167_028315 [Papaver somniferum]